MLTCSFSPLKKEEMTQKEENAWKSKKIVVFPLNGDDLILAIETINY